MGTATQHPDYPLPTYHLHPCPYSPSQTHLTTRPSTQTVLPRGMSGANNLHRKYDVRRVEHSFAQHLKVLWNTHWFVLWLAHNPNHPRCTSDIWIQDKKRKLIIYPSIYNTFVLRTLQQMYNVIINFLYISKVKVMKNH